MTMIHSLRWRFEEPHRKFVAERLKALKAALRAQIHGGTNERSLRLATWNIMHFGDGGGYVRTPESMLYIAEIIDHFDLVAVQEVNRDLGALERLIDDHLGDGWDYLVTDTSGGRPGDPGAGNSERLAFLYRTSKVTFRKEAGEIVLPEGQEIAAPGDAGTTASVQFARTPFAVAFRASWLKFKLCTVHIFYGDDDDNSPKMEQRRAEIERIAQFLADRQEDEKAALIARAKAEAWTRPADAGRDSNLILLGDFNIVSPQHRTMEALKAAGFTIPTELQTTNLGGTHHYDQIAIKAAHPHVKVVVSNVFDMLKHVYRDEDAEFYVDVLKPARIAVDSKGQPRSRENQIAYYKSYYRRHQLSDHKLLWCEITIDYSDEYLDEIDG